MLGMNFVTKFAREGRAVLATPVGAGSVAARSLGAVVSHVGALSRWHLSPRSSLPRYTESALTTLLFAMEGETHAPQA